MEADFSSLSKDEMALLFLKFTDKSLMSNEQLVKIVDEIREELRKRKGLQIQAALLNIVPEYLKPVLLENLENIDYIVYHSLCSKEFPQKCEKYKILADYLDGRENLLQDIRSYLGKEFHIQKEYVLYEDNWIEKEIQSRMEREYESENENESEDNDEDEYERYVSNFW